jgi:outer membrane lipopolysaccharide assembly protein LptE/RlpB
MRPIIISICMCLILALTNSGCGWYSLSGVNIPDDVKSISIAYFTNQAPQVAPTLSQVFTEKLRLKFQSETRMYLTDTDGDYQINGAITQYRIEPVGITGNTQAAENRLTFVVKVDFNSPGHPKYAFSKNYSNFVNFPADVNLDNIEAGLIEEVTTMTVQDIFNDIALKW